MRLDPLAWPKYAILFLIRVYQATLSRDHGWNKARYPYGACRFYPTCSEYSHQAIARHGVIKGVCLAIRRVVRCHPWSSGGYDPVK